MMSATQNCHAHVFVDVKPEMMGPTSGPTLLVRPSIETAIPRGPCLGNMSLNRPLDTVCGAAAPQPNKKRKNKNAPQFGARAQPKVKAVYKANEARNTGRRPQLSESGANIIGPKMYPMRKTATGSGFWNSEVTLKWDSSTLLPPLGSEDPRQTLKLTKMIVVAIKTFLVYTHGFLAYDFSFR